MSVVPGNVFYPQTRAASTLSTLIDADGKEIKAEAREDEEQKIKLQEIVDLLVAAGYFRARIKGLSSFDKVIGGMTWCIETCSFDVDVDLLFQENLTIGQKIALTEKIVAVLLEMKCPHLIEPHQIQGLDFIHIYPVIQWLVKRSVETREDMGNMIRMFAISQFDKQYSIPEERERKFEQEHIVEGIENVKNIYRPQRRFRRRDAPPEDEPSRVQSTLLEYGYNFASAADFKSDDGSSAEHSDSVQPVSAEAQKVEEQRLEALMKSMATMDQEGRLSASVVGNIVNLQAQEIAQAAAHYASLHAERADDGSLMTKVRASTSLQRQKDVLQQREAELLAEKEHLEAAVAKEAERLQTIRTSRETIEHELSEKMQALETDENQSLLKKLQALVILNESLKTQELEFREQCKVELSHLQQMVSEAENNVNPDENTEQEASQLELEKENVQTLRLAVAKRNRSIATLLRQLDEVPGRAELAQYQRRFLELYNQVGTKHKETKQFYTLYNTLDDSKLYLGKELSLLNSILDTYTEAMSSSGAKEQFMSQFEAIVDGIKQNKSKIEARRNEERLRRDKLSKQLLTLVETQRNYVAAVRQLTIECRKNENLLVQLKGS